MKLHERIKALRKLTGLTQENIADILGILRTSYTQLEAGRRKLSIDEAVSLSKAFNCSLDALLLGSMSNITKHELKTWPQYFEAVLSGKKNFEVRINDRPFKVGDTLLLKEWCPENKRFTGRETARSIGYILQGGSFGIESGTVVMSLA